MFFKNADFSKDPNMNWENIYDYMISDANIRHATNDFFNYKIRFSPFIDNYISGEKQKNILDISGGSGWFLSNFKGKNNNLVITEINSQALNYAKDKFGMYSIFYDLNECDIADVIYNKNKLNIKFDLIMIRACGMFIKDMRKFLRDLKEVLSKDGLVIMSRNVQPTIGVFTRVQFDEYSYLCLYQPSAIINEFNYNDYEVLKSDNEADIYDFYLTSHDLSMLRYAVCSYYQHKAIMKLRKNSILGKEKFGFRRRDRQLFYVIARKKS